MKFNVLPLSGAYLIEPAPFNDSRGMFTRLYCQNEIKTIRHDKNIVQVNYSCTHKKGTIRGMHYQIPPFAEIKIVKVIRGKVYDVIIDLRQGSSTFLSWVGEVISAENMKMMYVPEGFAHGFQTLEDECELLYFHTEFYTPQSERAIWYNDPMINIKWISEVGDVSPKDQNHPLLEKDFQGIKI